MKGTCIRCGKPFNSMDDIHTCTPPRALALAEQQEGGVCARCGGLVFDPVIPQKQQEPVAWGMMNDDGAIYDVITPEEHARCEGEYSVPLYVAPLPRREVWLTDEEIDALPWGPSYDNPMTLTEGLREFARAVIEAYKAKQEKK